MNPDYNFWEKIKKEARQQGKPFFVLAPMADVTDAAFRRMFAKYGKPDVTWTEFVSADGLVLGGRDVLIRDLEFTEGERPIVAQLFTNTPSHMYEAVKLCRELGFDGVDLNMGCPDKSIEKQGSGAAHIKDIDQAKKVIAAAREAAGDMPISVKTRLGYNKIETDTWLRALLELQLPALSVHLRTRKELSLVDAHWDIMPEILELASVVAPETLIIGNGDIKNLDDGLDRVKSSGADGGMIGRGVFGNPFAFNSAVDFSSFTLPERFKILLEHTRLFEELLGDIKSFSIMKKHYKAYVNNFDGAKELRTELMDAKNSNEIEAILNNFLNIKKPDNYPA
jgi:nifR3 family TIM-barrel protein